MNVFICSDLHLGKAFSPFRTGDPRGQSLYDEALEVPEKLSTLAAAQNADAVLIAGDLFEQRKYDARIDAALHSCFEALPRTHFFISPGNVDPLAAQSPYLTGSWPDNVHIFGPKLKAFELDAAPVRVYGAACTGQTSDGRELFNPEKLPKLDPNYINILLLHRVPAGKGGEPDAGPLLSCGFDLCVFGHAHKATLPQRVEGTDVLFPGALIPHGFRDAGSLFCGTVSKGVNTLSCLPLFPRDYVQRELDVSGINSARELKDAVLPLLPRKEDLTRLVLRGTSTLALRAAANTLAQELAEAYFYIQLIDRTEYSLADPDAPGDVSAYAAAGSALEQGTDPGTDPEVARLARNYVFSALADLSFPEVQSYDDI